MKKYVQKRKCWESIWLDQAELLANSNGTCARLKVGCLITQDNMPVMMAYNGPSSGEPHCNSVDCNIDVSCKRSQHAERNCIDRAAKVGIRLAGGIAHVTHMPCFNCYMALTAAGISKIYYRNEYKADERVLKMASKPWNPPVFKEEVKWNR